MFHPRPYQVLLFQICCWNLNKVNAVLCHRLCITIGCHYELKGISSLRCVRSFAVTLLHSSGDWLYTVVLWITLIIIVLILYLMTVPLKYTHNVHHDTWGQQYVNKKYTSLLLIVPSFILALVLVV